MIRYPRNRLIRTSFQILGRTLVNILTKTEISNHRNYPNNGRLIVVANHTGVMETVLMTCFSPRPIEYMGSVDIPHEPQLAFFMNLYRYIPVYRGNVSISSMKAGLEVLNQEGVLGIFPEGGIWEPAIRKAQSGVAWLSYHGRSPVLPIGFNSTAGKLKEAISFKRPSLKMTVGKLIPPVTLNPKTSKKIQFERAAQQIMEAVWELIPNDERMKQESITNEQFDFDARLSDEIGNPIEIPAEYKLTNGASLSKLLYRSTLINNFRDNLNINIAPLKNLDQQPTPQEIIESVGQILNYLKTENPYYFSYRYGQAEGKNFQDGLLQFYNLAHWAKLKNYIIQATPVRRYTDSISGKQVIETHPPDLDKW